MDEAKKISIKTNLKIESYSVSEKGKVLISKTGVAQIEYFKLNGTLKEENDLQITVEVCENGKFKEEGIKSHGAIEINRLKKCKIPLEATRPRLERVSFTEIFKLYS